MFRLVLQLLMIADRLRIRREQMNSKKGVGLVTTYCRNSRRGYVGFLVSLAGRSMCFGQCTPTVRTNGVHFAR